MLHVPRGVDCWDEMLFASPRSGMYCTGKAIKPYNGTLAAYHVDRNDDVITRQFTTLRCTSEWNTKNVMVSVDQIHLSINENNKPNDVVTIFTSQTPKWEMSLTHNCIIQATRLLPVIDVGIFGKPFVFTSEKHWRFLKFSYDVSPHITGYLTVHIFWIFSWPVCRDMCLNWNIFLQRFDPVVRFFYIGRENWRHDFLRYPYKFETVRKSALPSTTYPMHQTYMIIYA